MAAVFLADRTTVVTAAFLPSIGESFHLKYAYWNQQSSLFGTVGDLVKLNYTFFSFISTKLKTLAYILQLSSVVPQFNFQLSFILR